MNSTQKWAFSITFWQIGVSMQLLWVILLKSIDLCLYHYGNNKGNQFCDENLQGKTDLYKIVNIWQYYVWKIDELWHKSSCIHTNWTKRCFITKFGTNFPKHITSIYEKKYITSILKQLDEIKNIATVPFFGPPCKL